MLSLASSVGSKLTSKAPMFWSSWIISLVSSIDISIAFAISFVGVLGVSINIERTAFSVSVKTLSSAKLYLLNISFSNLSASSIQVISFW